MSVNNEELVRIVVIDISNTLGASVYDEVILPIYQATDFVSKYINMEKYRIVTI